MTIASEKRLLTAPNSKLANADPAALAQGLNKQLAWDSLPLETRQRLYALLPAAKEGEPPHDPDVNPMRTAAKVHIEAALGRWQNDVKDGREVKKWRDRAMQAGRERREGKLNATGLSKGRGEEEEKAEVADRNGADGKGEGDGA